MRRASLVGIAAGLMLAAASPWPARAAAYGLVFPSNQTYPAPYLTIEVDDPGSTSGSPAVDVGAGDFTIELFLRAQPGVNTQQVDCAGDRRWDGGAVVLNRMRGYDWARSFGMALTPTRVVFGVHGPTGAYAGLCGTTDVADGSWHHIAVQRSAADGRMTIWVDGALDGSASGPAGDVSYPDDALPVGCCELDRFLTIGGKDNYGPVSVKGSVDELRVSDAIRYSASFARPARAFSPDARTVALYHFDEGSGSVARDAAGDHDAWFGTGASSMPLWSAGSPFGALPGTSPTGSPPPPQPAGSGGGGSNAGHPGEAGTPTLGESASTTAPGEPVRRAAGSRATPPRRTSAMATAAPIAGGLALVGFLLAMALLGLRAAQRRG